MNREFWHQSASALKEEAIDPVELSVIFTVLAQSVVIKNGRYTGIALNVGG
jgi:hypothetical protein